MDASLWMAIADTAIKTGTQVAQMAQNKRSQRRAFDFQKQMYDQQIKDMVKYNDPAYLVGRMKASGINPYLGSGAGAEFGGNVGSSAPSAPAPSGSSGINPNLFGSYQQSKLLQAQIDNINADTQEKLANAGLADAKTAWQKVANEFNSAKQSADLQNTLAQTRKLGAETSFTEESINKVKAETSELASREKLEGAQRDYYIAQRYATYLYAQLQKQETRLHAVQTLLSSAQIQLNADGLKLDAQKVKIQAGQLEINGKAFDLEKELRTKGFELEQSKFIKDCVFSAVNAVQSQMSIGLSAAKNVIP